MTLIAVLLVITAIMVWLVDHYSVPSAEKRSKQCGPSVETEPIVESKSSGSDSALPKLAACRGTWLVSWDGLLCETGGRRTLCSASTSHVIDRRMV